MRKEVTMAGIDKILSSIKESAEAEAAEVVKEAEANEIETELEVDADETSNEDIQA